ncbi:MAG TPA: hypothetical protein DGH68_12775 [Bacteroidetes bacterium]|jgi:hypothetical protein|nr:hypothetical protein [Bacteroidota bacterium]
MIWKYVLSWFGLLIVAMINGGLRDALYRSAVGELAAHQISTLTGIIFFALLIWWMTRLWPIESAQQAWAIGIIWLVMTVCFEFGFFHFVAGRPWSELLEAYNVLAGQVWVLVLIWVLIAPYVFYSFARRST